MCPESAAYNGDASGMHGRSDAKKTKPLWNLGASNHSLDLPLTAWLTIRLTYSTIRKSAHTFGLVGFHEFNDAKDYLQSLEA